MDIKKRKENFILKSNIKHNNKYDYSKVEYIDSLTKVCIICPEHGEFWQTPQAHVRGNSCPLCSNKKRGDTFRLDLNDFIENSNKIHNNKYDYSKVEYINSLTKVCIICPEHGEFYMLPSSHLQGQGCPKCKGKGLKLNEIIDKANKIHNNKYDYSKVVYTKMHNKVIIICPIHGEFEQTLSKHISKKQGCPKCGKIKTIEKKSYTTEKFIELANNVHNFKYDYSKVKYNNIKKEVEIICPKHGSFFQVPNYHLCGHGCPSCGNIISNFENEINDFINSLNIKTIKKERKILNGNEIDIFVPNYNLGIECDGLYWHSELYKNMNYHLEKTLKCNEKNIRLLHIFEDEWINKQNIIKSIISNILHKNENKIYARKCVIKNVDNQIKQSFLNDNHLQGDVISSINIGLYHNDELISIMCFGKKRLNLGHKNVIENEYELLRFCNKLNTSVIGGASKLFKYFIKTYNPNEIISYCDRRYGKGLLYEILGFKFKHFSKPNYYYIIGNNRKNRFKFRKNELVKQGFDKNKSEHEIMKEQKIYRIYDCGNYVFLWTKKET